MDIQLQKNKSSLHKKNKDERNEAFQRLINDSQVEVSWAYEIWDDLVAMMKEGDDHQRSIAAQLLANLAKSDPEGRMVKDLDKIFDVTRDEKFVTARHTLQCLWKIAIVNKKLLSMVLERLTDRYTECISEKNCTSIRHEIIVVLKKIFDITKEELVESKALRLIEKEEDLTYRKKYAEIWRDNGR